MGTYQIRRAINTQGVALWFAEYITHSGEVRYLAHAAVPDPIHALIQKLTGKK